MSEDSLNATDAIDTVIQIGAIGVAAGTAAVHGASQMVTGKTKQSKATQRNRNPNLSSTKVLPTSALKDDAYMERKRKERAEKLKQNKKKIDVQGHGSVRLKQNGKQT